MQQSTRIILLLVLPLTIYGTFFFLKDCCEPEGDPELRKGIQLVRYMSAPWQLRRSSFLVFYPDGKPSDFVNWMFSPFGTAEWPPTEGMVEMDEMVGMQARSIGAPILPNSVRMSSFQLVSEPGKQVVVKADDTRGMILVEGFLDPEGPPEITDGWPLKLPDKK
ncbi:MAG: hypothetical protein G3M70_11005 [Candidatus Nitronauta litoralis]|uniref:Uncharacterized protein n=1 Tax=Candidatus Nitronauta litoralis TaxID=2705533 RepID=A0A7T0BWX9_9BACT|nr:MAG: hypothetical protein G3M70_11005 [Candidatus Nitronauta litoralis]